MPRGVLLEAIPENRWAFLSRQSVDEIMPNSDPRFFGSNAEEPNPSCFSQAITSLVLTSNLGPAVSFPVHPILAMVDSVKKNR
jgi:hypothetical protein